ncbi:MAG: tetratricopeptide repeat protein, partial [Saprospiraceae bacterium]|nr:tetratricopeptide repeat protein [Pyrinomonadaceae bacterium]
MNKNSLLTRGISKSRNASNRGANGDLHSNRSGNISSDRLNEIFAAVGQKLRDGLSSEAENILTDTIEGYRHTADDLAGLKRLLAFTLETVGRYKESLDVVKPFEDEEVLKRLNIETQVRVMTQLAISYNNLGDHPKAVTLLKETLQKAKENDITHLSGSIDSGLARVYRKLNECAICRDYAEKSLNYFRENGNWLGMAEAYREIALSYHQEGNSEKSLEYFELGIKIIGDRSAPFMLGKFYSDMSGAYWFLRRPQDGIACLEKSIAFFDRTEHVLNSVIAYNNLGINLMLIGEWTKAEEMIKRSLDIAVKAKHVHVAGILESLGELKILRGDLTEAEDLLTQAVAIACDRKREWYQVQAMRNLARCYLAQGKFGEAAEKARETIDLCHKIGDKHYVNMAGLVLAESYLNEGGLDECENYLKVIEDNDPGADFFVLGNIQRIRGLASIENGDKQLAVHHFNRSLTIFETAEDLYHTALAHYLIGGNFAGPQASRAVKHLTTAGEIFKKLGIKSFVDSISEKIEKLKDPDIVRQTAGEARRTNSVVSQLLMVRLAEATASRELLFRELIAVLQQESKAKKIILAEPDENKKLQAFITHG